MLNKCLAITVCLILQLSTAYANQSGTSGSINSHSWVFSGSSLRNPDQASISTIYDKSGDLEFSVACRRGDWFMFLMTTADNPEVYRNNAVVITWDKANVHSSFDGLAHVDGNFVVMGMNARSTEDLKDFFDSIYDAEGEFELVIHRLYRAGEKPELLSIHNVVFSNEGFEDAMKSMMQSCGRAIFRLP